MSSPRPHLGGHRTLSPVPGFPAGAAATHRIHSPTQQAHFIYPEGNLKDWKKKLKRIEIGTRKVSQFRLITWNSFNGQFVHSVG